MIGYRPDIDGLRAIAVSAVVLFHAKFGILPGGFTGVDVFFVISGYLIASIVLAEIKAGTFTIGGFYERRIRRIMPALLAVTVATIAVGAFIVVVPQEYANIAKSARATLAFYSNFYFAKHTGYFAPDAETQPFLHTWSLAVEEQFYIVAPILLVALAGSLARWRWLILGGAFAASLYLSAKGVATADPRAFFKPHTRAFELILGVALAMATPLPKVKGVIAELAAALGLALIFVAFIAFGDATPFPGLAALVPCVGAALIIFTGSASGHGTHVSRLLSWQPLVALGKISYSLYLWHWPVFVYGREWSTGTPSLVHNASMIGLSLALAAASYAFIEQPFRHNGRDMPRQRVFALAAASVAMCAVLLQGIILTRGWPGRLPAEVAAFAARTATDFDTDKLCLPPSPNYRRVDCEIGSETAELSFIVWGDSHARSIANELARAAAAKGLRGYYVAPGGCAPIFDFYDAADVSHKKCRATSLRVANLLREHPIRHVILVARWSLYAPPSKGASESVGSRKLDQLLLATSRYLTGEGRSLTIFGPVPEPGVDLPKEMILGKFNQAHTAFTVAASAFATQNTNALRNLGLVEKLPRAEVLYPHQTFCDSDVCRLTSDDDVFFLDSNHLSPAGAQRISALIDRAFAPLSASASLPAP